MTAVADSLYSSSSLRELDQTTTHFASSPPYLPPPPTHSTATVAPLDLTTTTDSVSRQCETYNINNNNHSQKNDNKYDSNIHEEHQHGNNNANDGNNSAAVAFSQVSLLLNWHFSALSNIRRTVVHVTFTNIKIEKISFYNFYIIYFFPTFRRNDASMVVMFWMCDGIMFAEGFYYFFCRFCLSRFTLRLNYVRVQMTMLCFKKLRWKIQCSWFCFIMVYFTWKMFVFVCGRNKFMFLLLQFKFFIVPSKIRIPLIFCQNRTLLGLCRVKAGIYSILENLNDLQSWKEVGFCYNRHDITVIFHS